VEIDYEHLERSLADRLVDQPLSIAIPAMTGTVTPRAMRIYPSNGAIVVGSLVDIDLPGFWPDVTGWVYLTANPTADPGGFLLRFDHLSFAPPADSSLWRELSLALDITLRHRLEHAAGREGVASCVGPRCGWLLAEGLFGRPCRWHRLGYIAAPCR
jgi:hypothetical protein